jgi:hypothetical protein
MAAWTRQFSIDNPELDYALLDETSAIEFIANHYGEREQAAFRACAHPAMQADYVRLCLMDTVGGAYLDASMQSRAPLAGLIANATPALLPLWEGITTYNGILIFHGSGHPFIRACLALATDNITHRRFDNILIATGPGVLNAVRWVLDPQARAGIDEATSTGVWPGWNDLVEQAVHVVEPTDDLLTAYHEINWFDSFQTLRWIGVAPGGYKSTEHHWTNWKGSIYKSASAATD